MITGIGLISSRWDLVTVREALIKAAGAGESKSPSDMTRGLNQRFLRHLLHWNMDGANQVANIAHNYSL
jgi:phosphopantetheinyl transferase